MESIILATSAVDRSDDPALVEALRRAVAEGALVPAFQPIVHLQGGAISGFEVLARWNDRTLGDIPPAVFIPMAERLGLIGVLTRDIIVKACTEAARWAGAFRLALNISPLLFQDRSMPDLFEDAVERSGFLLSRIDI